MGKAMMKRVYGPYFFIRNLFLAVFYRFHKKTVSTTQSDKCRACQECCQYVEFPVTMLSLEVVEYFIFRGEQAHIDPKNGVMSIRIYKPCHHLTEQGCGIYEDRPETCRLYMCDIKDASIKELKSAMFKEGTRLILQAIQANKNKKQ